MFKNAFDTTEGLDHVCAVVIEVPEFSVVASVGPPEWVLFQDLVLLEILSDTPAFIVGEGQAILLEERVDSWDTVIPGFHEFFGVESSILRERFLLFECVLCPDTLGVKEFGFPRLNVAMQVRDQLIFFVAHACAEMRDAEIGLLVEAEIALRDEDVSH